MAGVSWSPPDATHDDFLIDRDKNPNTAGLRLLTGDDAGVDALLADAAAGRLRALILLRTDLAASHGDALVTQPDVNLTNALEFGKFGKCQF